MRAGVSPLAPPCTRRCFQKQLDALRSWWCWGHRMCFHLWLPGVGTDSSGELWTVHPVFRNCFGEFKPVWRYRTNLKSSQSWKAPCTALGPWPSPLMAICILERVGVHFQSCCGVLYPEKPQGSRAHMHFIFSKSWTSTVPPPPPSQDSEWS